MGRGHACLKNAEGRANGKQFPTNLVIPLEFCKTDFSEGRPGRSSFSFDSVGSCDFDLPPRPQTGDGVIFGFSHPKAWAAKGAQRLLCKKVHIKNALPFQFTVDTMKRAGTHVCCHLHLVSSSCCSCCGADSLTNHVARNGTSAKRTCPMMFGLLCNLRANAWPCYLELVFPSQHSMRCR